MGLDLLLSRERLGLWNDRKSPAGQAALSA
jgi:hypothetical protein